MMNTMAFAVFKAYYTAKHKVMQLRDEECGMDTVETVMLLAISLIVGALLVNILTKRTPLFDNEQGLIGYVFERIREQIDIIFSTEI